MTMDEYAERIAWPPIRAEAEKIKAKIAAGARFVTELREGDDWTVMPDGRIIIVNPAYPPRVIDEHGLETEITTA